MATIFGDIQGVKWLRASVGEPGYEVAEVAFTMGAYTAGSDNGQLGGTGTKVNGVAVATGTTMAQILASKRRDGKTVTIGGSSNNGRIGLCAEPGKQGVASFFADTLAVSSGNVTFNLANATGTEIDAPAGVVERPITLLVFCTLT